MDKAPKSAYEIALEKLNRRDRERGEAAPVALTEGQKQAIAEIRKVYEARLAEQELRFRSDRPKLLADPEGQPKLEKLEQEYAAERRRLEEQRDAKIMEIRQAGAVAPKGGARKGGTDRAPRPRKGR
ncbi:MAG TPA: hypothetical protein VFT43_04305 [Candidatus Polarisedimenticolia bacterium]|nr:hypothetical protein [Candidatus Polarisedimenticolia bacterium]